MNNRLTMVRIDKKNTYWGWRLADMRFINGLSLDAREAGIEVRAKDVMTYLNSSRIRSVDPVDDYIFNLSYKWDGHDHIGDLADRVKTDLEQWKPWFRMWFYGMVAQWMAHNRQYSLLSSADMYFNDYFDIASPDDPDAMRFTATDIYDYIRHRAGSKTVTESLTTFGRYLSNVPGIQKLHTKSGTVYYVKYRVKDR